MKLTVDTAVERSGASSPGPFGGSGGGTTARATITIEDAKFGGQSSSYNDRQPNNTLEAIFAGATKLLREQAAAQKALDA